MAKHIGRVVGAAFGLLTVCAVTVRPAAAVPGPSLPIIGGPGAVSVGAFFPNSDEVKDAGGETQVAVDFHYTLPVPNPLDIPTRTMINVGVETGARAGNHSTIIPITISEVVGLGGSPVGGGSPYVGAGVGIYIVNTSGLKASSKVGGFAQLGYNITSMLFVDAKYQFVEHANGAIVSAGLRF